MCTRAILRAIIFTFLGSESVLFVITYYGSNSFEFLRSRKLFEEILCFFWPKWNPCLDRPDFSTSFFPFLCNFILLHGLFRSIFVSCDCNFHEIIAFYFQVW